ncbi:MAG: dihydroorotate dehydrogenase electron transfer subunit [Candidatus Syntropharchaeia archaeon]
MRWQGTYRIKEIREEAKNVKSFFFETGGGGEPGQFVMVWIPPIDEKPMSLSYVNGKKIGITVKKVGEATGRMHDFRIGEYVGLRGPFGRGFGYEGISKALIVGGGMGIAPLAPLAEAISREGKVTMIIGAKTSSEIFFLERLENLCERVIVTTDDGSLGMKGDVIDGMKEVLEDDFEKAFLCGPENMMVRGMHILEKVGIPGEVSIERWIKCGIGICGGCALDPMGIRVCKEGPVFDFETIKRIEEFGRYKRLPSGRIVR